MLDNHPGILCHHEIFNPHVVGVARSLQDDPGFHIASLEEREANPERVLEQVWDQNLGNEIVGIKLCWRQHKIYKQILADKVIHKIILKRRNRIRSYVSLLLARKTTEWVVYDNSSVTSSNPKVRIDLEDLWSVIDFNEAYHHELETEMKDTGQIWLEAYYEELFTEQGRLEVLEFLNVPNASPKAMQPGTLRLNNRPLTELIENYEEVVDGLKNTSLEKNIFDE
jgi:LPS sulfotransferase NodH